MDCGLRHRGLGSGLAQDSNVVPFRVVYHDPQVENYEKAQKELHGSLNLNLYPYSRSMSWPVSIYLSVYLSIYMYTTFVYIYIYVYLYTCNLVRSINFCLPPCL